jgi:hypothetical protein
MSGKGTFTFVLTMAFACAGAVRAEDPFEQGDDDTPATQTMLRHGERQIHDLQGTLPAIDQDWIRVFAQVRHSYEARVNGLYWDNGCGGAPCPRLARVSDDGTVLTAGVADLDDIVVNLAAAGQTVRWTAGASGEEKLRVRGDELVDLPATPYTISFRDTTLLVPRWNSSGSQTTVIVVQNPRSGPVVGLVHFYNASGILLQSVGLSVPAYGVNVISTGSLPLLAGLSGSAQITHDGGYGGLTGKAVALEPSTGFTFDTLIAPIPY